MAREAGLGGRINTVLQTCFFHLTELLPPEDAVDSIKEHIRKTYGKRGQVVVRHNEEAVDRAVAGLFKVEKGPGPNGKAMADPVPKVAPDFVKRVTAVMMAGKGDLLPVSAFPVDGTFPTGTARWEKRSIAGEVPIWDPEICIDCGRCALVCPHAAIRFKAFDAGIPIPDGSRRKSRPERTSRGNGSTIQVAPDDCTGCGICVEVCPAKSKEVVKHKALNMLPKQDHLDRERRNFEVFLELPETDRALVNASR